VLCAVANQGDRPETVLILGLDAMAGLISADMAIVNAGPGPKQFLA
jgi:hypothetical protein